MQQIGISDIQRNLHKLDGFDIVEILDKKRGLVKGYFLDKSYAPIIDRIIKEQAVNKGKVEKVAGSLASFASSSLKGQEKGVWKAQVKEKYQR